MKENIHPDYHKVVFMDTNSGFKFLTGSTKTSNQTTNGKMATHTRLLK